MTDEELKTGVAMIMLYETAVQHPENFPGIACSIDNCKLEATLEAVSRIEQDAMFAAIGRLWSNQQAHRSDDVDEDCEQEECM